MYTFGNSKKFPESFVIYNTILCWPIQYSVGLKKVLKNLLEFVRISGNLGGALGTLCSGDWHSNVPLPLGDAGIVRDEKPLITTSCGKDGKPLIWPMCSQLRYIK